ncbi:tetratricopeptide repeat protein, partial [Parvimonas sp. M13]
DRFEDAQDAYEKTLKNEEPTPETLCCLAAAFEKQMKYEEAIKYYKDAIALDPLWDEGWYGVGVCLYESNKWFQALHFLRKALNLNK